MIRLILWWSHVMGKPGLSDYQLRGLIIQVRDAGRAGGRGFACDLLLGIGMWNRPCRRLDYAISRPINDHESLHRCVTHTRTGGERGERLVRFNCCRRNGVALDCNVIAADVISIYIDRESLDKILRSIHRCAFRTVNVKRVITSGNGVSGLTPQRPAPLLAWRNYRN